MFVQSDWGNWLVLHGVFRDRFGEALGSEVRVAEFVQSVNVARGQAVGCKKDSGSGYVAQANFGFSCSPSFRARRIVGGSVRLPSSSLGGASGGRFSEK